MKKSLKSKSLALLLALVMVIATAFTGCGSKDDASDKDSTDNTSTETEDTGSTDADVSTDTEGGFVLDVCVGPEPETIDPTMNTSVDGATLVNHAFEGLMKINADKAVVNGVAESYSVSDDGLVYTFKIRSDAKWSDGTDLTADSFVYSCRDW